MTKDAPLPLAPEMVQVQQALSDARDSVHDAVAKLRASASGSYQAARSLRLEARRERIATPRPPLPRQDPG